MNEEFYKLDAIFARFLKEIPKDMLSTELWSIMDLAFRSIEDLENNRFEKSREGFALIAVGLLSIMGSCGNIGARTTIQNKITLNCPYVLFRSMNYHIMKAGSYVKNSVKDTGIAAEIALLYLFYTHSFIFGKGLLIEDINKL